MPDATSCLIGLNPEVMRGKLVVRNTRITVEAILEKLAADFSVDEILEDYPQLTRQDVLAAVDYARKSIGTDDLQLHLAR